MKTEKQIVEKNLRAQLQSADCAMVLDLWLEARTGPTPPRQSDIDIVQLMEAVPFVIVLDFMGPDEVLFRFSGSVVNEVQGLELTGKNFLDLAPKGQRDLRKKRLAHTASGRNGAWSLISGTLSDGSTHTHEVLSLPILADKPGEINSALVASRPITQYQNMGHVIEPEEMRVAHAHYIIDLGLGRPDNMSELQCDGVLLMDEGRP